MRNLHFQLFGIPVIVEPWFWLIALLLGLNLPPESLLIWIPTVFVGVMVHELGHAAAGRYYGLIPSIRLHSMGGLTSWARGRRLSTWPSVALSLAGPAAGFALGFLIWSMDFLLPHELRYSRAIADVLWFGWWVNIGWGLINLLPVLPLDGGNVMRELVYRYVLRPAPDLPARISMFVAGGMAALWFMNQQIFAAMLFGWLAYSNYMDSQRSLGTRWR